MEAIHDPYLRKQLLSRQERLKTALSRQPDNSGMMQLLEEVDAALERIELGTFGLCKSCHDPIESDRLLANPLEYFCLDHLTTAQKESLERDLELASGIQGALLPRNYQEFSGWQFSYIFQPARMVSGDYCDLIAAGKDQNEHYFFLGDISGKGVAASLLMSHLHAIFRSLIASGLPLLEMLERANQLFCENTLPESYATLVCGKIEGTGEVELINADHCSPFICRKSGISQIPSRGLPIGLFCQPQFKVDHFHLDGGDLLFMFTDGLLETRNLNGEEFGMARIEEKLKAGNHRSPREAVEDLLQACIQFRDGRSPMDDLALMALRRNL
jgi:phosphoserine phosphatase RsbU/P